MNIIVRHKLNQIHEGLQRGTVIPMGVITFEFLDSGTFILAGDLISEFDTLLSESLKVITKPNTKGHIYSDEASGILSISMNKQTMLVVTVFEDFLRLNREEPSHTTSIKPLTWLCMIADEYRTFQDNPGIGKETIIRCNNGVTISLLDALI